MRRVPKQRLGTKAAVRVAEALADIGCAADLGAPERRRRYVPDVVHHIGEHRADRGISRVEAVWSERRVSIAGETGGSDFPVGERIEVGKERCASLS